MKANANFERQLRDSKFSSATFLLTECSHDALERRAMTYPGEWLFLFTRPVIVGTAECLSLVWSLSIHYALQPNYAVFRLADLLVLWYSTIVRVLRSH